MTNTCRFSRFQYSTGKICIYDQRVSYLEKECLRFNFQFGFGKGYSTEYTILETLRNLKSAIDDEKIACGIFL